jgi:hypothetical protein
MTSTIKGNNSVGSLLKPLLKKVTAVVGSRMLWKHKCKKLIAKLDNDQHYISGAQSSLRRGSIPTPTLET